MENNDENKILKIDYELKTVEELETILKSPQVNQVEKEGFNGPISRRLYGTEGLVVVDYPYYSANYKGLLLISSERKDNASYLTFIVNDTIKDLDRVKELASALEVDPSQLKEISIKDDYQTNPYGFDNKVKMQFVAGKITKVVFSKSATPAEITEIMQRIADSGFTPELIEWHCENRTYPDLDKLVDLNKKYQLSIDYGSCYKTDADSYLGMRSTIDYYKDLINTANLSPVEKLMYAYDLIKSYSYNEQVASSSTPRNIPGIIATGQIVCVGYSEFLKQLLEEIDIKATVVSATIVRDDKTEYHARNFIRIDDDKYDIHGIYALDSTWDSNKKHLTVVEDKEGEEVIRYNPLETDTVKKDYDGLTLYQNFLVSIEEYTKRYPNEVIPGLARYGIMSCYPEQTYLGLESSFYADKTPENIDNLTKENLKELFGKKEIDSEVKTYMSAKKPSLETFQEVLRTVRTAEGYTSTSLEQNISDTIELNRVLDTSYNKHETFFQPKAK